MIIQAMNPASPVPPATASAPVAGYALPEGHVVLSHLGVIRVEGADAVAFLQGQLTQDMASLSCGSARLAAFCSAKGRMQASFYAYKRSESEIFLVCSRDILAPTLKRLTLFVMRAKAKLTDVTDAFTIIGLAGQAALAALAAPDIATKNIPNNAALTGTSGIFEPEVVFDLPPAGKTARGLLLRQKSPTDASTEASLPDTLTDALWRWGEVQSGVATITAPIVDAFVPQMLNFESAGGVNFKKGCYPGQEVVARSQFRGTLKRRAYLVHSLVRLAAGDEVFADQDNSQPCGTVAQAAAAPGSNGQSGQSGGFDAIVSMQVAAAGNSPLRLGSSTGPLLELRAMPYPLLDDI